jgi:hypothetical protein
VHESDGAVPARSGARIRLTGAIAGSAALVLLGGSLILSGGHGRRNQVVAAPVITTVPVTTAATTMPTTTTSALPPSTQPRPAVVSRPRPTPVPTRSAEEAAARALYRGLGTWADVYDWTAAFTNGNPRFGPADVDAMAAQGVQTLYIQAAHAGRPDSVLEPQRLLPILARAHQRGLRVVAWYLPDLTNVGSDLAHLTAISRLAVDSVAVDIESKAVSDVATRNARLVDLSRALRAALPGRAIGAIVLPPVLTEVINPAYWPDFPWRAIAPFYDVWLPMAYWSFRSSSSGYRDGYRYTADSVIRLRNDLGRPGALVHAIGGVADQVSAGDAVRFVAAARATSCLGASLYDWRTTAMALWPTLRTARAS